jgi:hypothetical protein
MNQMIYIACYTGPNEDHTIAGVYSTRAKANAKCLLIEETQPDWSTTWVERWVLDDPIHP